MQEYDFTLEGRDGMYTATFDGLHIKATVERVRESHDHEVKGEVTFVSSRPLSPGHLRNGRINLTSATSRNSMAKSLTARDPEVDWDKVLEQLCVSVLHDFREGSPALQLNQDPNVKDPKRPPRWIVHPIIQTNNPTLIFGEGSAGKSWLAQYIAVLVDEGIDACGLTITPPENRTRPDDAGGHVIEVDALGNVEPASNMILPMRSANVLYLDWETDFNELGERVRKIRRGLGLEGGSRIWYRQMSHGLAVDIEAIRKLVISHSIGLIVIDSLGSACMGEPESAEVVLRAFNALRSLKVSSLCIDHVNKAGEIFGSVYKKNASRQVFEVKNDQQSNDDRIVIGMFHRKSNNSAKIKEIGLEIMFHDEDTVTISRRDVRDTDLEVNLAVVERVQNYLRNQGKAKIGDIAEDLKISESHVRKEISNANSRNARKGHPPRFVSLGGGIYANGTDREEEGWLDNKTYLE
jgi:hypothetical protein